MFSGVVVGEGRPERGLLSTDVRTFLNRLYHFFICLMPILSSAKVDLFFLSFSIVNKCDERKKHDGHKHTLRATQGVWPVTTAFREFMRDYWLLSYMISLFAVLQAATNKKKKKVTLIPRRGQSSVLARRYKHSLDTFLTHLVYKYSYYTEKNKYWEIYMTECSTFRYVQKLLKIKSTVLVQLDQ